MISTAHLDYWSRWRTEPKVRTLAEDWITQPPSSWYKSGTGLYALFDRDPSETFAAILAMVQIGGSDELIAHVAAGPLEDFLGKYGEQFIEAVHAIALREPQLRHALQFVWRGSMSTDVWRRVEILRESAFS